MVATILFLGANPSGTTQLALGKEVREIDQRLRAAPERERFRIEQAWAVRADDLQQALLRHRPAIVHFSGHGSPAGEILVDDGSSYATPVPPRALAGLFRILGRDIRCVVLNACYSEAQARAIVEHVDIVVGMSTAVEDWAAIAFAGAFYQALGHGEDVQTAFELGRNQIELMSTQRSTGVTRDLQPSDMVMVTQADIPRLLVREGVQAGDVRLVARNRVAPPIPPPSTPPPSIRPVGLFIGRATELRALEEDLLPASGVARPIAICAIQGMPGVGKSYLAEHFAALHAARFPGGLVRLVLRPDDEREQAEIEAALLGQIADQLHVPAGAADAMARIRARLQHPRTLLHLENIDALPAARAAVAMVSRLRGCPVVITGRYQDLGARIGWSRLVLAPFDEAMAMAQLEAEFHPARTERERESFRCLASALGRLPLALHLAAAHLREGDFTVKSFLAHLRTHALDVETDDPLDDPLRANLRRTFELSLDLLRRHVGVDGDALAAGFASLGHAPLAGFGRSLGAAIAGLAWVDFDRLVRAARLLSLLMVREEGPSPEPRWYIHPLLAEMLRRQPGSAAAQARMTAWFMDRLPGLPGGQEAMQGQRWKEIHQEYPALVAWLHSRSGKELVRAVKVGGFYAVHNGPFAVWLGFHERALASAVGPEDRSMLLWAFMFVAQRAGALDTALKLAAEKERLEKARGNEHQVAVAAGCRADILKARGKLDEALRIQQEEALPIYEKLGDMRSRAVAMGKIADILQVRERLDEALRIRREEELPVYEQLGDVRSRAVAMGKIADILQARGELDEALRIRHEEELPAYEQFGDMRERAMMMAKIADILQARGELDEALRILQEEVLPAFEKLGDLRSRAVALGRVAHVRQVRGELDEALRILREEVIPVYDELGDLRSRAFAMGKIADILQARGRREEALRIRQHEELPVYEQFGDVYPLLRGRAHLALALLARRADGDRDAAAHLLQLAHEAAQALRVPEVDWIRRIQQRHGLLPSA